MLLPKKKVGFNPKGGGGKERKRWGKGREKGLKGRKISAGSCFTPK
jgi:hypothetical protein